MSRALPANHSWPSLTGMARQSIHQRFDIRSTEFFMAVLCDLMQQCYRTIATAVGSRAIQRILIEDAPGKVMPKFNADSFPTHGNHYGKTSGVKIDFAFDLLTGSIVSQSLQAATEQDKSFGKEFVIEVHCGDLVLRDMGYFSINKFTEIEQRQAWWLTHQTLFIDFLLVDGRTFEKYPKSCFGISLAASKTITATSSPCAPPRKSLPPAGLNAANLSNT